MDFLGLFLDKAAPLPLYEQLYRHLAERMAGGGIPAEERLPGKRAAAAQLGVSVNTVDQAYQMLAAEGYVEARPRSGFVVNAIGRTGPSALVENSLLMAESTSESTVPEPAPPRFSFATGAIDTKLFPAKLYKRIFREVLGERADLLDRGHPFGDPELRETVGVYLRGYRGVRCRAGQIVVGAGLEILVSLLARLLDEGPVALEDPGYPKTGRIFQNEGVPVVRVTVDGEGLDPAALAATPARAAYLTPSHQFPTGAVMPIGRRAALLAWAAEGGRVLIEDDYDSEFRFDGRPLPSLQGLDQADCVVYAGTFSRSLAPGLRAAYLVLPPALMERWRAAYGDYSCSVSRPEQQTLARFLAEGHFARSLNRMRIAYRKKRDLLTAALAKELPAGSYRLENAHTGHYLVLQMGKSLLGGGGAQSAAAKARAAGVYLRALDSYRAAGGGEDRALLLGYGGFSEEEIGPAAAALAEVLLG